MLINDPSSQGPYCHLAVFRQPFLNLIFEGVKTIESRFSKTKIAPFKQVKPKDKVLMKESGGKVLGEFTVQKVIFFENFTSEAIDEIKRYDKELGGYIAQINFSKARYATLMFIQDILKYQTGYSFPKRDQRGWIKLSALPERLEEFRQATG
jgi:ASC-1-like (ASCH) protein